MSSSVFQVTAVPKINDLVRVAFGTLEDRESEPLTRDVPSRVEDVHVNKRSGQVDEFVIAAPFFSGDLELPAPGSPLFLQWLTPRGVCVLPVAFNKQDHTDQGLRRWRLKVTGTAIREERRRFVRVSWALTTELHVRRNLDLLTPDRRRLAEMSGVRDALKDLPDVIEAQTANLSEGGMLCLSADQVLPAHLPVVCHFMLEGTAFEINAFVVWSVSELSKGKTSVESALVFDDTGKQADVLRPLLFRAQSKARRSLLD